eukprot:TRINITY_DN2097_c0_g1_i3.p1 TRINITY_DN2097_c0_g1~~TRINITY_DN2097_c0_g1_i3.p1  ORF type:complete len:312 (-),score=44.45 TRINITY_DN2097_c0_g1_i3:624-1559(-)
MAIPPTFQINSINGTKCWRTNSLKKIFRQSREIQTRSPKFFQTGKLTIAKANTEEENIYVGFDKDQQKPRYQKGDPTQYPGKEDVGIAMGITGGWAGGEKGLKEFVQNSNGNGVKTNKKESTEQQQQPGWVKKRVNGKEVLVKVIQEGGDTVYVGDKFLQDDDRKYPSKDTLGPFEGVTGGFAGGETGLKSFLEKGKVEVESEKARKQFSPLTVAAIVASAGVGGGIGLTYVTKWAVQLFVVELLEAPIDDNTKLLLEVAMILLATAAVIAGGRFAFKKVWSVDENWAKYATLAAVTYGALFVIARTLIDV